MNRQFCKASLIGTMGFFWAIGVQAAAVDVNDDGRAFTHKPLSLMRKRCASDPSSQTKPICLTSRR